MTAPAGPRENPALTPSKGRLLSSTGWNLVGLCAPMLAAVFAIPLLLRGLGEERFGTLTLIWMLVGYFNVLDLGLGRALTKFTAEYLGREQHDHLPRVFWTSMAAMSALGLAGGAALFAAAPWLSGSFFKIPEALRAEACWAFRIAAAGLPVAVSTVGLIGVLEAHQRFRLINIVRLPMGTLTFVGPLAVLPFTSSLSAVVAVLIAGRVLEWLLYFAACMAVLPDVRRRPEWDRALLRPLLTFGGWMTISNIILPLLIHVDRFVIGAVRGVEDVAYFATPAEVIVKLLILPRAWVSVLFPLFTAAFAAGRGDLRDLYGRGVRLLLLAAFPAALGVIALGPEGLRLWLGPDMAERSTRVLQWLTAGIFLCSLSYVPYSLLQGAGRPDVSAKLHLVELPLYVLISMAVARQWGITAVAATWCARAGLEALAMFAFARRTVRAAGGVGGRVPALVLAGLAGALAAAWPASPWVRLPAAAAVLAAWLAAAWRLGLSEPERAAVRQELARRRPRALLRRKEPPMRRPGP